MALKSRAILTEEAREDILPSLKVVSRFAVSARVLRGRLCAGHELCSTIPHVYAKHETLGFDPRI